MSTDSVKWTSRAYSGPGSESVGASGLGFPKAIAAMPLPGEISQKIKQLIPLVPPGVYLQKELCQSPGI